MFGLFVPLLDILVVFANPEEWAELDQPPIHNLLLKSIVRSWMEFLVAMQLLNCTYDYLCIIGFFSLAVNLAVILDVILL